MAFETIYGTGTIGRPEPLARAAVRVESRVELKAQAKKVVSTTAKVFLGEVERTEAEVRITGRVVTRVIFIDEHDGWNSEEKSDNFTEKLILKDASSVVSVMPALNIIDTKVAESTGMVEAVHTVEVGLLGIITREVRWVSDLKGDLEVRREEVTLSSFSKTVMQRFEIEERLDLDKGCEGVLGTDVSASIRDLVMGEGKINMRGILAANISAVRSGEGHNVYNDNHEVEFLTQVTLPGVGLDDRVFGNVVVTNLTVRAENKTKPELVLVVELCFMGQVMTAQRITQVTDAFAYDNDLEFTRTGTETATMLTPSNITAEVEGNLNMAEGSPFIARILSVEGARIATINMIPANDKVTAEGVMNVNLVYECEEKNVHTHNIQLPFSTVVRMEGCGTNHGIFASVVILNTKIKARRGRELFIDARLGINLSASTTDTQTVLGNVIVGEAKTRDDSAIMIYTAEGRETLWDIAKRISVPMAEIVRQNPHLEHDVKPGDKVFIYRQIAVNF